MIHSALIVFASKSLFSIDCIGRYPAYDGHPKFLVDWELKKRDKALALQQEVERREDVLITLQAKINKMENEHHEWMARHQAATDAEVMHRKQLMEAERKHLLELQAIEQEISRQRVVSLGVLENTAAEEMELMDRLAADAHKLLHDSEAHMRDKMELTLNIQKHRELAESAEAITLEKLNQVNMRRAREEWARGLATSLRGKEEESEARDALLQQTWRQQDEAIRQQRSMRAERARNFAQSEEMTRLQEETTMRMQRLHMAREAKVLELERARALRLAKEQAEEALEASERSALLLKKQEVATTAENTAWLAESAVRQAHQRLADTATMVREESERLLESERAHALRYQQTQQQARTALLRKEWADKQAQQLREVLDAESDLQQQMLALQRASIKAEVGQGLAAASTAQSAIKAGIEGSASSAIAAAKSDIEQLSDEVMQRQRNRFLEMQRELGRQREQAPQQTSSSSVGAAGGARWGAAQKKDRKVSSSASSASGHDTDNNNKSGSNSDGAYASPATPTGSAPSNPRWFASPDDPVPVPHTRQQHQQARAHVSGSKISTQRAAAVSVPTATAAVGTRNVESFTQRRSYEDDDLLKG